MKNNEKLNLIKNIIDSNLETNDKFELIKLITKDSDYFTPNGGLFNPKDNWFNPKEEGIKWTNKLDNLVWY